MRKGFTSIELLIVIAIIGLLVGIVLVSSKKPECAKGHFSTTTCLRAVSVYPPLLRKHECRIFICDEFER